MDQKGEEIASLVSQIKSENSGSPFTNNSSYKDLIAEYERLNTEKFIPAQTAVNDLSIKFKTIGDIEDYVKNNSGKI